MKFEPKISIIIPIYNAEEYLEDCLKSVSNQKYNNVEMILINDGSTDTSIQICKKWEERDSRVVLINQSNKGRVAARRVGVQVASGDYISFIDADDWIDDTTYVDIIQEIQNAPDDIDMIAFGLVEEFSDRSTKKMNSIREGFYTGNDLTDLYKRILCEGNFWEFGILPHLCDKLIKRELLFKSGFLSINERITYGEDALGVFGMMLSAKNILVLERTPYHYRQSNYINGFNTLRVERESIKNLYDDYNTYLKTHDYKELLMPQVVLYFWFIVLLRRYVDLQKTCSYLFPFMETKNKRIVVYGAGGFGIEVVKSALDLANVEVVGWVDKNYQDTDKKELNVQAVDSIMTNEFDYIFVAILNEKIASKVEKDLVKSGIDKSKVLYITKEKLINLQLPEWLTGEM